jgi:long-chain acyl-CoA synthetase
MLGYLDDPGLTAFSFSDSFFRTGALAKLRADGRVELVGRAKEMISRGENRTRYRPSRSISSSRAIRT